MEQKAPDACNVADGNLNLGGAVLSLMLTGYVFHSYGKELQTRAASDAPSEPSSSVSGASCACASSLKISRACGTSVRSTTAALLLLHGLPAAARSMRRVSLAGQGFTLRGNQALHSCRAAGVSSTAASLQCAQARVARWQRPCCN